MNGFQWLSLLVLSTLLFSSIRASVKHRLSTSAATLWSLLWIAAACAILWPNASLVAARLLGIQRGTDLVLYLAILTGFVSFFAMYLRLRRIEAQITALVRDLALSRAFDSDSPAGRG